METASHTGLKLLVFLVVMVVVVVSDDVVLLGGSPADLRLLVADRGLQSGLRIRVFWLDPVPNLEKD